jgi:hypothetical protein
MTIICRKEFRADQAPCALDIATINGITIREGSA